MKIYNKIIIEWNEETQHYDKVVYEDSFEYEGEMALCDYYCEYNGHCECWPNMGDEWDFGVCEPVPPAAFPPPGECNFESCPGYEDVYGDVDDGSGSGSGSGSGEGCGPPDDWYESCCCSHYLSSPRGFCCYKDHGGGPQCMSYIGFTEACANYGGYQAAESYCVPNCWNNCEPANHTWGCSGGAEGEGGGECACFEVDGQEWDTGWDCVKSGCEGNLFFYEPSTGWDLTIEEDYYLGWMKTIAVLNPCGDTLDYYVTSSVGQATCTIQQGQGGPEYVEGVYVWEVWVNCNIEEHWHGSATINATVSGNSCGIFQLDSKDLHMTVTPVADQPMDCVSSYPALEDTDANITIGCNNPNAYETVTDYSFVSFSGVAGGGSTIDCSAINITGVCVYSPGPDVVGLESFTYNVATTQNASGWDKIVYISIEGSADTPQNCTSATDDFDEDSTGNSFNISCTAPNVYESITSYVVYPAATGTLYYDGSEVPSSGIEIHNPGENPSWPVSLTYDAPDDQNWDDSFGYEVNTSHEGYAYVSAIINITPVADTVSCDAQTLTPPEGSDLNIYLFCDVDSDNESIESYTTDTAGMEGTLSCSNDACYWSPPNADYNGSTSFNFTGTATDGGTGAGTIIINVVDEPDSPIINLISDVSMTEHQADKTVTITASDVDTLMADLDWDAWSTAPQYIDLTITGTETGANLVISLDGDWHGVANITVEVNDGTYWFNRTFQLTVTPVGDAPVCPEPASSVTINEDTPEEFSFICVNEAYGEGIDPDTYEIHTDAEHGTTEVDIIPPTVYITYTPDPGWSGDDSFTYRVKSDTDNTWSNSAEVSIEVISVSDQPGWLQVTTGTGIIDPYAGSDVIGWAVEGAAIYEGGFGGITFVVDPPDTYDCQDIYWDIDSASESAFSGTINYTSNYVCSNTLMLIPWTDWNTYTLDGIDFVDNPIDITITVTPTGGDELSLEFPLSVVPTSDLPVAPDMYAGSDYYDGEGMDPGLDWNFLSFIWHKTGIDESGQESVCGDGGVGLQSDNKCIYDPDPWDNNVWWVEEHGWICDTRPTFDYQCSGSGTCGPGNNYDCIETTPMYTYQAVEVKSWNQWGVGAHGGIPELWIDGRCDNAYVPITYMENEAQGNATIEIIETNLPFTFPTDQETHVPYFMDDVGGISKNLELTYQCEDFGGDYIEEPIDFEITYRVVECMYFTTDDGAVDHWGLPYCAESDELGWECDDVNPLKCSPYGEMWVEASVVGTRAGFGADGGGRGPIQFYDESVVADDDSIVTWAWDFGDGETSDQQNPTHSYDGMGTYTVQLTIEIDTDDDDVADAEKITQRDVWIGSISHHAGWNIVSTPVESHDMSSSALFPGSIYPTLYAFNAGYQPADELEVGKGYWLRFYEAGESIVAGLVPSIGEWEGVGVELNTAWNLIGGLTFLLDFNDFFVHISDPDEIVVGNTLYNYELNGYHSVDDLVPGEGYWLRTNGAGMISIHEPIARREGGELPGRHNDVEIDDDMVQELIDAGADLRRI